eukprot:scaffold20087_cov141-Skeletonema_dohrnii-CCMP3373.AAC.2
MNKERFKEASKLRKQRNIKLPSRQERENAAKGKACDDADIAKRTSDLEKVIEEAFDPNVISMKSYPFVALNTLSTPPSNKK